jgi:hypothetical protein
LVEGKFVRRSWLRLFWAGVVVLGVAVGYLWSSGLGEQLVHREIETQLGRLLAGPVEFARVELRFAGGLRLEAHSLEAYPSADPTQDPVLRARRVLAWIDFLALLVGRLELSTLVLEGPHLRVERTADGSIKGLPLPRNALEHDDERSHSLGEEIIEQLEWLDPAATEFAERFRAADRIEIVDGTLQWIDHQNLTEDGAPNALRLELVSGFADRDWLSEVVAIEADAVVVNGVHAPFPIEVKIERNEGPHFEWTLALSKIPLEAAQSQILTFIEPIDGLAGTVDARFHMTTTSVGTRVLSLDGLVQNAKVSLRRSKSVVGQERVEIHTEIALEEKALRISEGALKGERLGIEYKGAIARPISQDSSVRFESRMVGVDVDGIRDLANQFEGESDMALAISRSTQRVEAGRIRYIEVAGTAPFRHWQDLSGGRTRNLPDGFRLVAAIDNIVVGAGVDDRIEDLTGEIEWSKDQISLRQLNGTYRGTPLPEINAVLEGISHLIRTNESARRMTADREPVPGVFPLLEIFKPQNPNSLPPVKAIGLAIDHLEHAVFRWPFRDLRVLVEPLRRGLQLNVREGTWGGAAVSGNVTWFNDSKTPTVNARLTLGPPPVPQSPEQSIEPAIATQEDRRPHDRWGKGRFEVAFRPRPTLPFKRAVGFFRLDGGDLIGNEIEIELVPQGKLVARANIDLRQPDHIGFDFSFAVTEAKLEGISEFVALPADLATGDIGATGSLAGLVRPETNFIAELDGRVRVEAEHGRIATSVPLLIRLGKASEGYNPFANQDELQYESMTGTLELDHGLLGIEDFEIEGPLRVFANARLDTNRRPGQIRAVVGIFLFRASGDMLGNLPLVRSFLPGSKHGLIGAYFEVDGPVNEPEVEALTLQTLMSNVPSAIKAPFKVLQFLFGQGEKGS